MKILFATEAWPAERDAVGDLARALGAAGHAVVVVARASGEGARTAGNPARFRPVVRDDPWPEHWQKTSSPVAARAFRAALEEERPDVLHVHHWRGLTRELVHLAALARVPAVVTLHDPWTSCPIGTRVRPDTGRACDAVVGVHPCVACAGSVPPRTPWVPREAQYMALAERQRDLERELRLARAVLAPSAAHAEACRRFLGAGAAALAIEVVEPPAERAPGAGAEDDAHAACARAHVAHYERAVAAGAPEVARPADDWFGERMRAFAVEQWDRSLAATPRAALGLDPG